MTARGADVVVIGGGAIGLACAYYLARAGARPVVLDRGPLGAAASTHNQHMVLALTKVPGPLGDLALRSAALYWQLQVELGDDFDTVQSGTLMLYETEDALAAAAATVDGRREAGLRVQLFRGAELQEIEPLVAPDLAGGLLASDAFQIDPARFVASLARASQARGAVLRPGVGATGIEVGGGRVEAVLTTDGRLPARAVVCAAGPWSREVGSWVGIDLPVTPRRGIVIETAPAPRLARHMLMDGGYHRRSQLSPAEQAAADPLDRHGISFVLVQRPDGRCLLGGSREHVGFGDDPDPLVLDLIRQRARRFLPGAPPLAEARTYWGFRPYSDDRLPFVGPVPAPAGFYVATGHEGSGLTLAPATGEVLAELVTRGRSALDVAHLTPARPWPPPPRRVSE